jgi:hypothetical protein
MLCRATQATLSAHLVTIQRRAKMNRVTLQSNDNAAEGVLYMAMESGDKRWKLVFSDGGAKRRHETVEAGRRMQLVEAISKAKAKFHLSPAARVVSCYEAGRQPPGVRSCNHTFSYAFTAIDC